MKQVNTEKLYALFQFLDDDGSGCITMGEFNREIDNPKVQLFFGGLGVDHEDAKELFAAISDDGDHDISLCQFIHGCMHLKGAAKSLDMLAVLHDIRHPHNGLARLAKDCRNQFKTITHTLDGLQAMMREFKTILYTVNNIEVTMSEFKTVILSNLQAI